MRRLRLYSSVPSAAVEREPAREPDASCSLCAFSQGSRNVCMSAELSDTRLAAPPATAYQRTVDALERLGGDVEPAISEARVGVPTLFVLGESPSRADDAARRPFTGESGAILRDIVAKHWRGPVVFDNSVRCFPGRNEVTEKHVDACRGYLTSMLREAAPSRIVTFGSWAAYALMGRSVPPMSARRAYAYLFDLEEPVPVFFVLHPAAAMRNRFMRHALQSDLKWALTCAPPRPAPVLASVRVIDGVASAREAIAELTSAEWAAFDVESCGVLWEPSFTLLSVSACAKGSSSPFVWDRAALADPPALAELIRWLESSAPKLGQNTKFDVNAVRSAFGAVVRGVVGDTRLWRRLLEPSAGASLAAMSELVGMGGTKEEAKTAMQVVVDLARRGVSAEKRLAVRALQPTKKWPRLQALAADGLAYLQQIDAEAPELGRLIRSYPSEWEKWSYALVDADLLGRYNGRDSVATARLADSMLVELEAVPQLNRIRHAVVDGASRAISSVERWGVAVDRTALSLFDAHLERRLGEVGKRIAAYGFEFNRDSPKQVAEVLFEKLGLKPPRDSLTPSGNPSTGKEVLADLANKHPLPRDLLEWRKLTKLKGTYAGSQPGEGMLAHVRSDGRIHTSILLDGARSGRTSSQDPNLQNIPRASTPEGKMARDIFVAPHGYTLIQLDYSQLELRVAAMLSGDPEMIEIFASGVDYHQRTAELISQIAWGIAPSAVTKEHRAIAKTINFAMLYGAGDDTIAEQILANGGGRVTKVQVAKIREAILGKLRRFAAWIEERVAETRKTGLAWTWWNGEPARRRQLWEIADYGENDSRRSVAEHGAFNTPVQGTGSEFCVASLAACVDWIEANDLEEDVKLVLPVHDSLLFEVRESLASRVVEKARGIMTGWNSGGVPLLVDVEIGKSWGSLKRWEATA